MDRRGGSFRQPQAHWISEIPRLARERGEARRERGGRPKINLPPVHSGVAVSAELPHNTPTAQGISPADQGIAGMFRVRLRTNRLSDGSETYDVILTDHETADDVRSRAAMQFHTVTYKDAVALVDKFREAVMAHTNDDVSAW